METNELTTGVGGGSLDPLVRSGYVLAMRLLQSDLALDEEQVTARDEFIRLHLQQQLDRLDEFEERSSKVNFEVT